MDELTEHLTGRRMPVLTLPATDGSTVDLAAFGPGRTVLYVYPMTARPGVALPPDWDTIPGARGCTPEACGFRDHHDELHDAGTARVYGLSAQDTDYQREMVARLGLPFAVLADPGLSVAAALGLPTFTAAGGDRALVRGRHQAQPTRAGRDTAKRGRGMTLYRRLTLVVADGLIEHVFHPVDDPGRHAEQVRDWLLAHPR